MAEKRDYYDVLSVSQNAGEDEIKKAYRRLAIRYHPDKNPGDKEAEEKFKEATEAYGVLRNTDKRGRYDRFGHAGPDGTMGAGGFDFGNFEDIVGDIFGDFGDLFGFRSSARRQRGPKRGRSLQYDLEISLEDAILGTTATIEVPRLETCQKCHGAGAEPGSKLETCPECFGRGQVTRTQGFFSMSRTCPRCQGEGRVVPNPCQACNGQGLVRITRKIKVGIPKGVDTGFKIQMRGEGEAGVNGGPPGDLFVVFHVAPHERFVREGDDLITTARISFIQAALGVDIEVPTIDGTARLTITAGAQYGKRLRIPKKGVPYYNHYGSGDLIVEVRIETPTNLTERERELLAELGRLRGECSDEDNHGFFDKLGDKLFHRHQHDDADDTSKQD
ncbi:MAG: molecular chaperone DnaJ [Candidatus Poribacteria bacterium]|nr:molecular chaperone DnaJ [Candidatus Poribacteria bacterium]